MLELKIFLGHVADEYITRQIYKLFRSRVPVSDFLAACRYRTRKENCQFIEFSIVKIASRSAARTLCIMAKQNVFFDIGIGGKPSGRIVMEVSRVIYLLLLHAGFHPGAAMV